jgi:alanine racemase
MGDQPIARTLSTHTGQYKYRINTQTSMPRMGFKPITTASEWVKTVQNSDRSATVICTCHFTTVIIIIKLKEIYL